MEALAYGIALRKAWNLGETFRSEWTKVVTVQSAKYSAPQSLTQVPLILLAPADFWKKRIGTPGRRTPCKVFDDGWEPLTCLFLECGKQDYPVTVLEFDEDPTNPNGLPEITKVRRIVLPLR